MINVTNRADIDVRLCALVAGVCAVNLGEASGRLVPEGSLKRTGSPQTVARRPQERRDGLESGRHLDHHDSQLEENNVDRGKERSGEEREVESKSSRPEWVTTLGMMALKNLELPTSGVEQLGVPGASASGLYWYKSHVTTRDTSGLPSAILGCTRIETMCAFS